MDHHIRCKQHNFISTGFAPDECPYCRIEALEDLVGKLRLTIGTMMVDYEVPASDYLKEVVTGY